jgi:hypothetical protein
MTVFHQKIELEKEKWFIFYNLGNSEIQWHLNKKLRMNLA